MAPVAAAISAKSSGATNSARARSSAQSIEWPGAAMKPSSDMHRFTTTLPLISRPPSLGHHRTSDLSRADACETVARGVTVQIVPPIAASITERVMRLVVGRPNLAEKPWFPLPRAQPPHASGLRSRHSLRSGGAGTHRTLGFSAGFRGADGMSPASVSSHSVLERTADTEPAMNIYDPSEYIRYVHLSGAADARSTLVASTTACSPLPSGYANQSPRTRLQRQPAQRRGGRAGVVSLTA